MHSLIHGGDVYTLQGQDGTLLDFSANINPLGIPPAVEAAAAASLRDCARYPDPLCRELRAALAEKEGVPQEWILCGCGAAELIFRWAAALKPRAVLLPVPAFAEYERALETVGCAPRFFPLPEEEGFRLPDAFEEALAQDLDTVILTNPHNPTGLLLPPERLRRLLFLCRERGIRVLLDECFLDFTDAPEAATMRPLLGEIPGLFLLKAFTKLYAMAGLRLGYGLCADAALLEGMTACGQPWSVSIPAQAAGIQALRETAYVERTRALIRRERAFLWAGLERAGAKVLGGEANFLFFRCSGREDLTRRLEEKGILLRACGNFRGLSKEYYRTAVRTREENRILLEAVEDSLRGMK